MNLNKVIIWGHQLHNHTHSYIHNAFYIAFKYLGYKVYWFNKDGINNNQADENVDFENALYIVHGVESENLPLNETSFYISHNVEWKDSYDNNYKIPINNNKMTKGIPLNNILSLQVLTIDCINFNIYSNKNYYRYTDDLNCIFLPWGTDLIPEEIDENIKNLDNFNIKNISNFIGMFLDHWNDLKNELAKYNIEFKNYGGTFNINSNYNKSIEDNIKLIQESIIAPALQTQWQVEHHYIPCRIFKNISYGKMGITNNYAVYKLFNNKIIYSDSIEELVKLGLEFNERIDKNDIIKDLMIEVRDNHTYINRINFILDFIKEFKNVQII